MAEKRKLQAEIDRCLKKVAEGVEIFDETWQKVIEAPASQKYKYEADLKKEIKKLQRLRDNIKTWLSSNDIKDKQLLIDKRKLIEQKMEQFKVVERETKMKAFSKSGLTAEQKMDPKEKEREETNFWLQDSIGKLKMQCDHFESEIESLGSVGKRKKPDKDKQEKIEELKEHLEKHKHHIQRLECVMRLLDNNGIAVEKVLDIKDNVNHYIDYCLEPDFQENEYIYDDLNLDIDELKEQLGNVTVIGSLEEQEATTSETATTASTTSPSPSPGLPSQLGGTCTGLSKESSVSSKDSDDPPRRISTSDEIIKPVPTRSGSTSRSTPTTPLRLTSQPSQDRTLSTPPPIATPPSYNSVAAGSRTLSQTVPKSQSSFRPLEANTSLISDTVFNSQIGPRSGSPSSLRTASPIDMAIGGSKCGSSSPSSILPRASTPVSSPPVVRGGSGTPSNGVVPMSLLDLEPVSAEKRALHSRGISSSPQLTQPIGNGPKQDNSSSGAILASQVTGQPNALSTVPASILNGPTVVTSAASEDSVLSLKHIAEQALPSVQSGQTVGCTMGIVSAESLVSSFNLNSSTASSSQMVSAVGPVPSSSAAATAAVAATLTSLGQAASLLHSQFVSQAPSNQPQEPTKIPPILAASPLGRVSIGLENTFQQSMLDAAFHHLPHPADSEKFRNHMPRSPVQTPMYYPQYPPPGCDTLEFYSRLAPETLFFIFYYTEGTRAQLHAAKALKKQAWRFHTKYMMWFQRHEEPREITDQFEKGTYIYFDFEKWAQRKKEGFVFEYQYLEDHEL